MQSSNRSSREDSVFVRAVSLQETDRVITFVDHGGTAACLCFDSHLGQVLLIEQERPVLGLSLLEVPSGRVEDGETPEDAAARELLEETGYRAGRLTRLGSFFSSVGLTNERIHIFTTEEYERDESVTPESTGQWLALSEISSIVSRGDAVDGKTALAVHWLMTHHSGMDES